MAITIIKAKPWAVKIPFKRLLQLWAQLWSSPTPLSRERVDDDAPPIPLHMKRKSNFLWLSSQGAWKCHFHPQHLNGLLFCIIMQYDQRTHSLTLCQFQRAAAAAAAAADFISSLSANIICMHLQMRKPSIWRVMGEIGVLSSVSIRSVLVTRPGQWTVIDQGA